MPPVHVNWAGVHEVTRTSPAAHWVLVLSHRQPDECMQHLIHVLAHEVVPLGAKVGVVQLQPVELTTQSSFRHTHDDCCPVG